MFLWWSIPFVSKNSCISINNVSFLSFINSLIIFTLFLFWSAAYVSTISCNKPTISSPQIKFSFCTRFSIWLSNNCLFDCISGFKFKGTIFFLLITLWKLIKSFLDKLRPCDFKSSIFSFNESFLFISIDKSMPFSLQNSII